MAEHEIKDRCDWCKDLPRDADGLIQGTVIAATPPKDNWKEICVEHMIKSGWPRLNQRRGVHGKM